MYHIPATTVVGTIFGVILGMVVLNGGGFASFWDLILSSFAGAATASPLGLFSGITGGLIGGLIGIIFVQLPISWIFSGAPILSFLVPMCVAAAFSTGISLLYPH